MIKQILSAIKVSALALVLSFGLSYVYAWTAPTQNPPSGNVSAPLNTSSTGQMKDGGLLVGHAVGTPNGLIVENGNVGVGTTNPLMKLEVGGSALFGGSTIAGANRSVVQITSGNIAQDSFTRYGFWNGAMNTGIYDVGYKGADSSLVFRNMSSGAEDTAKSMYLNYSGNVGIGTTAPAQKLSVAGVIESTSGGIKFPDATVQTTAVAGATYYPGTNNSCPVGKTLLAKSWNPISTSKTAGQPCYNGGCPAVAVCSLGGFSSIAPHCHFTYDSYCGRPTESACSPTTWSGVLCY